jgi:hypothetical protein
MLPAKRLALDGARHPAKSDNCAGSPQAGSRRLRLDQLDSSAASGEPEGPQASLVLPAGLISGLLRGLIAAFWADRSGKRRSVPSG